MDFPILEEKLKTLSNEILDKYKEKLNGTELVNSITVDFKKENDIYSFTIELESYWKYIEEGRQPGKFPPINSILNWVRRKNIPIGGRIKTPEQMAFVIARHIKNRGIPAKPFLNNSFGDDYDLANDLANALADDIENNINQLI